MSKTKIAFFINFLKIGGIERALLNLVKILPKDEFDITVYVGIKEGSLLEETKKYAKVIEIPQFEEKIVYDFRETLKKYIKKLKIIKAVKLILQKMKIKLKHKETNFMALELPKLKEKFDVAVAYQVPISAITLYVSNNVVADKKILWSHCDMKSVKKETIKSYEKYFENFDYIISVSEDTNDHIKEIAPRFEKKCIYIDNVIDVNGIKEWSKINQNEINKIDNTINILTVARLAKGKGHDLAIEVTKKLICNGYNVKWFAVGDGEERNKLEKMIKAYNLEKNFIILGEKDNPYPYIKNCDIYVQPSEYEGACTATIEAKILEKPIVTTNTSGISKNFKDKKTAIITNYNVNDIYNAIVLLMDTNEREKLVENIKRDRYIQNNRIYDILKRKNGDNNESN